MRYPLRLAFSLLSRLPVTFPANASNQDWGWAVLYFPLVGLVLGGTMAALAGWIHLGPTLAAALLLLFWVWASGGLHLDGLADTADGWIGGMGSRERTLAIMKDAACGPAGVTSIFLILILKFAGLNEFISLSLPTWYLILPPLAGRWAMMVMILTTPYAREQGMGSLFWLHLPRQPAIFLIFLVTLLLAWLLPWPLFFLLPLSLWWWRRALLTRLAGSTGDTTGATCEWVEGMTLLICVIHPPG